MDVKPDCYDSVPACLCMKCQLYDVQQMVRAKSSLVSSRSPFLPGYAASLLSRPSSKPAPCAVSAALSSRPTCSVAVSTCGLADIDDLKSAREPVCQPDCLPRRPFLSRLRLDFADLSSSCFSPVASSGLVLPVSSTAVSSVGPAPALYSPVPSSRPGLGSGSFAVSSAGPAPVLSSPVSSNRAGPGSGSFLAQRPIPAPRVCPAWSSRVPSSSFVAPRYVPATRVWSSPVPASPFRQLPVLPMSFSVFFVLPVLLFTPFCFALSFVPLLR